MTEDEIYRLRVWSASLPAIFDIEGARPWNGRDLTEEEKANARAAYLSGGPQAAYEWLSEHAK